MVQLRGQEGEVGFYQFVLLLTETLKMLFKLKVLSGCVGAVKP